MGFVNCNSHITVTAKFEEKVQTQDATSLEMNAPTWRTLLECQAVFWQTVSSNAVMNGKIRPDIVGTVILDYEDVTVDIPDDCRVKIEGQYYTVIHANNIAFQNKQFEIPVKKYVS